MIMLKRRALFDEPKLFYLLLDRSSSMISLRLRSSSSRSMLGSRHDDPGGEFDNDGGV